jgi:hypothetical protein
MTPSLVAVAMLLSAVPELPQPTQASRPLAGIVIDSLTSVAVAGARVSIDGTNLSATSDARGRFTIAGVAPGTYTLMIRTPSLDSMKAAHRVALVVSDTTTARIRVPNAAELTVMLCGVNAVPGSGIVYGTVDVSGETAPPRNVRVVAEWNASAPKSLEARTNAQGAYRICGVPLDTLLEVRATVENMNVAPYPLRIPALGRMVRADLTLERQMEVGGVLTGVVVIDSTTSPIPGAEILLPGLSKGTLTDARGAFRIADIPAGEQELVIRRVGYSPYTTQFTFEAGRTIERQVSLKKIVTLDSVVTTAVRNAPNDFEEHRKLGLGSFMTRVELERVEGARLGTVISQLPGMGIVHARGTGAFVVSKQLAPSLPSAGGPPPTYYIPQPFEKRQGILAACYAQIYLDGVLMNPTKPAEPWDINSISPAQIEGIEWYAGPSSTPLKYSRLNSGCGVLVIHTRRK